MVLLMFCYVLENELMVNISNVTPEEATVNWNSIPGKKDKKLIIMQ